MSDKGIVVVEENGTRVLSYTCKDLPIYMWHFNAAETRNYDELAHWHNDLEFAVVLEGELEFCIDGEKVTVRKNQGIFINAKRIHFLCSQEKGEYDAIRLAIHAEELYPSGPFYANSLRPLLEDITQSHCLLSMEGEEREILMSIIRLHRNVNNPDFSVLALATAMNILCCLHDRCLGRESNDDKEHAFNTVKAMLHFIEENYAESITLADIANAGNVCKSGCTAMFNAVLNQPPVSFLIDYRLNKARELLQTTSRSVSEIATLVGFSGVSYFTERFRKCYGITPRDFRNGLQ